MKPAATENIARIFGVSETETGLKQPGAGQKDRVGIKTGYGEQITLAGGPDVQRLAAARPGRAGPRGRAERHPYEPRSPDDP